MEESIIWILILTLSLVAAALGCAVGLFYNFIEWITGKKFKWMYPIASILWVVGMTTFIVTVIVLFFKY